MTGLMNLSRSYSWDEQDSSSGLFGPKLNTFYYHQICRLLICEAYYFKYESTTNWFKNKNNEPGGMGSYQFLAVWSWATYCISLDFIFLSIKWEYWIKLCLWFLSVQLSLILFQRIKWIKFISKWFCTMVYFCIQNISLCIFSSTMDKEESYKRNYKEHFVTASNLIVL